MEEEQLSSENEPGVQRLAARAARRAGGRYSLCRTPGRPALPLSLARAGMLVVDLESDPEQAARMLQAVSDAGVRDRFQIYLKTLDQVLSESLDVYNVIGLGVESSAMPPAVLEGLYGRLMPRGVLILHGLAPEQENAARQSLSHAGFTNILTSSHYPASRGRLLSRLSRRRPSEVSVSGQKAPAEAPH